MIITAICVGALVFLLVFGGGSYLFVTGKLTSRMIGALVFGVIGAECLGIGSVIVWDRCQFVWKAVSTQGEIIDDGARQNQNTDGQWITSHAPKVRFVTAQERVIEFIGPVVENGRGYARGERVEVLYRPAEPETARIRAFDQLYLVAGGLFAIGGTFGLIALRVLLQRGVAQDGIGLRSVSVRSRSRVTFPPRG